MNKDEKKVQELELKTLRLLEFVEACESICRLTKQGRSGGFDISEIHTWTKELLTK